MAFDQYQGDGVQLTRVTSQHKGFDGAVKFVANALMQHEELVGPAFRKNQKQQMSMENLIARVRNLVVNVDDKPEFLLWEITYNRAPGGYVFLTVEGVAYCQVRFFLPATASSPEKTAEIVGAALPCLVEPFGYIFDSFPDVHWVFLFVNNALVDDLSSVLSQNGFDLEEEMLYDLVDRSVESLYFLARTTYGVYYRNEGSEEE
jgi:hypothetical protein